MRITTVMAFCLLCVPLVPIAAELPQQPNVLFIISDDLNTSLSGFGHPQCQTPELDKLATQGVRFENMHCQYPVCGSSRMAIMSGLYPYTNGALGNSRTQRYPDDMVTMSQLFRENGYYAGRISKIYHMGIPNEIIAGTSGHDIARSWDEAVNIQGPEHQTPGVATNWSPLNNSSQTFLGVEAEGDDAIHADSMAADRAIEFLEVNKDRPFFLAVGFVRPHVPLVAPVQYFDRYDRDRMEAPWFPENDLDDVPEIIREYKSNDSTYGVTPELHKGLLEAYYASVSFMDAQAGRVLDALEEQGLRENTIVVFSADHGYLLGHHDKYQKQHLFEESTRVPFILSVPWLDEEHGGVTNEITELIDLYPTLADLAGLETPDYLQGTSLKPLIVDTASSGWDKDLAFTISQSGGESIRTKDWRFTQWDFGNAGCELYDLNDDPGEFTNLAADPRYAEVLQQLKERLLKKRDEAGYQLLRR
jgi:iduronate 2-sulfatase